MNTRLVIIALLLATLPAGAQEGVVTFGLQFRPLIPNEFVNFREVESFGEGITGIWEPRPSLNFGGVIRYGITRSISIESGINLVRRNYLVTAIAEDLGVNESLRSRWAGYEVPIQALYYVKLSDKLWMNASGGLSIDMYPSNTFSSTNIQSDTVFYQVEQFTLRRSWVQLALQVNYGFEYRTKDQGYFYIGATYHQPFSDMALSETVIRWQNGIRRTITPLTGSYFTIDLRYFFHEDPDTRKKKSAD